VVSESNLKSSVEFLCHNYDLNKVDTANLAEAFSMIVRETINRNGKDSFACRFLNDVCS